MERLAHTDVPSPLGALSLVATDAGLVAVLWPGDSTGRVRHLATAGPPEPDHPVLHRAAEQLAEYFAAARRSFDVPLAPQGTEFQVRAWRALADIPYGQTASYAEQARRIGHGGAVRAVGAANGRNPLSIILPCHRVIGSNGALTGFAGGLDAKAALLDFEQRVLWGDTAAMPELRRVSAALRSG